MTLQPFLQQLAAKISYHYGLNKVRNNNVAYNYCSFLDEA